VRAKRIWSGWSIMLGEGSGSRTTPVFSSAAPHLECRLETVPDYPAHRQIEIVLGLLPTPSSLPVRTGCLRT
jgi:hypothetical protein